MSGLGLALQVCFQLSVPAMVTSVSPEPSADLQLPGVTLSSALAAQEFVQPLQEDEQKGKRVMAKEMPQQIPPVPRSHPIPWAVPPARPGQSCPVPGDSQGRWELSRAGLKGRSFRAMWHLGAAGREGVGHGDSEPRALLHPHQPQPHFCCAHQHLQLS